MKQIFTLIFLVSQILYAAGFDINVELVKSNTVGRYKIGIGSNFIITDKSGRQSEALFLGRAIDRDNAVEKYHIYYSSRRKIFLYIDPTTIKYPADIKPATLQPVINPYQQAGGTCTGYAIYNYLQQEALSGFKGNGLLNKKLSTEQGRTTLLVDNINAYYLTPQHRYSVSGVLNKYAQQFGLLCQKKIFNNPEKMKNFLLTELTQGQPVLVSFNLGPKMYPSPMNLIKYPKKTDVIDSRLWLPRKVGERNSGGHTIVLTGAIEIDNLVYLTTLDSDWNEPRIWSFDVALSGKTAIDEIEFIVCK